ncbi:hypothetical protein HYS50_02525 [Candidatus Woesearchaeota archaeon]|nr:hypothetical protein [Candidatus Woesearchaeota archaeon]
MEQQTIITILLVGLVLLSGVQALEIVGLKGTVTGTLSPGDSSSSSQGDQQQTRYSQAASSPQMVGGC